MGRFFWDYLWPTIIIIAEILAIVVPLLLAIAYYTYFERKVLAFSHTHSDHVGNANLFTAATLYIQQAEYDAAFGSEPSRGKEFGCRRRQAEPPPRV